MDESGSDGDRAAARTTTIGVGDGPAWWLRIVAVGFLLMVALETGYAFWKRVPLSPGGPAAEREATAQLTRSTLAPAPDAPHLQIALLQLAERGDDLALLAAAQVPLDGERSREVQLRFRDEQTMHRHNIDDLLGHEQRRELGAATVRAYRQATLPSGFARTDAALQLRFAPRFDADGCHLEVEQGQVRGHRGPVWRPEPRHETPLLPGDLRVGEPFVVTVPMLRLTAVVQLAPRAIDDSALTKVEHWREQAHSMPIPSIAEMVDGGREWWTAGAVLAALLAVGAWARRAPVLADLAAASPSRAAMFGLCLFALLELFGVSSAMLALMLATEWHRRPANARGPLPLVMLSFGIVGSLLTAARWWQLLPDLVWLDPFALLARMCALLLPCLWLVADPQRRGRACSGILFAALVVSASAHAFMPLGASAYWSQTIYLYAFATAIAAAVGAVTLGGHRTSSTPRHEPTVVAPAST